MIGHKQNSFIIVAKTTNNVIGINGVIPWKISNDLKHFKEKTINNIVIMGRLTYESIGKPLPNRVNIVISKNKYLKIDGCITATSLEDAIDKAKVFAMKDIYIIGGGHIYKEAIKVVDKLIVTDIKIECGGDTFFPNINDKYWVEVDRLPNLDESGIKYDFVTYARKPIDVTQ